MQYLALIYADENAIPNDPGLMAEYGTYTQEVIAAGAFKAGDGLQPVSTATSVRLRDGKVRTTDGPFAETKEQLGGYYLLDCENLDEAITWAAKIPSARFGTIEVRPVMIYDTPSE